MRAASIEVDSPVTAKNTIMYLLKDDVIGPLSLSVVPTLPKQHILITTERFLSLTQVIDDCQTFPFNRSKIPLDTINIKNVMLLLNLFWPLHLHHRHTHYSPSHYVKITQILIAGFPWDVIYNDWTITEQFMHPSGSFPQSFLSCIIHLQTTRQRFVFFKGT